MAVSIVNSTIDRDRRPTPPFRALQPAWIQCLCRFPLQILDSCNGECRPAAGGRPGGCAELFPAEHQPGASTPTYSEPQASDDQTHLKEILQQLADRPENAECADCSAKRELACHREVELSQAVSCELQTLGGRAPTSVSSFAFGALGSTEAWESTSALFAR
jgi:hypothetical protein